jgi:hypothetical protein
MKTKRFASFDEAFKYANTGVNEFFIENQGDLYVVTIYPITV